MVSRHLARDQSIDIPTFFLLSANSRFLPGGTLTAPLSGELSACRQSAFSKKTRVIPSVVEGSFPCGSCIFRSFDSASLRSG